MRRGPRPTGLHRLTAAICSALLLGLALTHPPAPVAANALNAGAGSFSGSIGYGAPEWPVSFCSWFDTWNLSASSTAAMVSLGGAEYPGPLQFDVTGTTLCPDLGVEEGLVGGGTITGVNNLNGSVDCTVNSGFYDRVPGSIVIELVADCAIDGATVVGSTTFRIIGAWDPWVFVNVPPGIDGVTIESGGFVVLPDSSVGLGVGPPLVTGITPSSGSNLGGTAVQISGMGFADGAGSRVVSITFGSTVVSPSAYRVLDDNLIDLTTPPGANGSVPVQVTTNGGSSPITTTFTYLPPPSVTSVSPNVGAGGGPISVYGSGFFGGQGGDQVQAITFQCGACGSSIGVACWNTVSDGEIDIPSYCSPMPAAYNYQNKTTFDVLVTTSVAVSAVNPGDTWEFLRSAKIVVL